MIKAVLFDFNGIIIRDEAVHQQLIEQILIEENLRFSLQEYKEVGLGRSDRACLKELLERRGRVVSESYLNQLITRKANVYAQQIQKLEKLPIYSGVEDFIYKLRVAKLPMGVVTGALRSEVELVLSRAELLQHFTVIVAGDDIQASKPKPDGYLLAVEKLKEKYPELKLEASECLAIEDTFMGIQAAKRAGIPVVGVANTYPFHMLQRCCNWTVDYLFDLELERVQEVYQKVTAQATATEC